MQTRLLVTLSLATLMTGLAGAASIPVVMRHGKPHIAAEALERDAGIVVKRLSSRGEFVACGPEQCARLEAVLTEGETWLVPVAGLSAALNLTATLDDSGRHIALTPARVEASRIAGLARVGSIAPTLRLTRLDGTPVSLDEFRGQRVLINSWASW